MTKNFKKLDKDVQEQLNNILILEQQKVSWERLSELGEYANTLLKPLLEHVADPSIPLDEDEAVMVLCSLALIFKARQTGVTRIPALGMAAKLFK